MERDEMVNGMSNGKETGTNGRPGQQSVRRKAQHSVARASRDVIDLGKSGGASPPNKQASSGRATKCRIRVIAVSCSETSDAVRRLERIAALLIGKVGPNV